MRQTSSILAVLAMIAANATAGVAPAPVSSGKGIAQPPPLDPCAGPISYNNVELLYASTDFGGANDFRNDADGVVLRAEYSPMASFYITASTGYDDWDTGNMWSLSAGIGAWFPLTQNIHLVAEGGLMYADWEQDVAWSVTPGIINYDTIGDNDSGWYARPHLRAKFGCFTLHAGAVYEDVADNDQWSLFARAYYQVARNWDLTAGYSDGEDTERVTAGVRFRY